MRPIVVAVVLIAVTLSTGPVPAQQQLSGTGDYCIKAPPGPIRCEYQTMAQCDQARPQGSADQCVARSQAAGTTTVPTLREQPNTPGGQKD